MTKYFMVRTFQREREFAKQSCVAIGWSDWNFAEYRDNVDSLLEQVEQHYKKHEISVTKLGRDRGQIRRFLSIRKGDVLIVPCYQAFMIGTSMGEFLYDQDSVRIDLANHLKVDFLKDKKGTIIEFSRAGKNTALASKLRVPGFTVLPIENQELIAIIDSLSSTQEDASHVSYVKTREEKDTEAFKKALSRVLPDYSAISLKAGGRGFEELIADLFATDGYKTRILSKQLGDGIADADILAVKKSGLSPKFDIAFLIQAKHYSGVSSAGLSQIIQFKKNVEIEGFLEQDNSYTINSENIRYVLISSAQFDESVKNAAEESGIILIDGEQLAEMLFDRIDDLGEQRYKLGFIKKFEHVSRII